MLRIKLLLIAPNRMRRSAGLPRRGICIRAVHHVFNPESETEETIDEDGPGHLRRRSTES